MSGKTTMYRHQKSVRRQAFAAALEKRMAATGINQKLLAEKTRIPPDQISRYCNAQAMPRPMNQDRLARALGCSRTELLAIGSKVSQGGEYMSFRSNEDNRVTLELRKQVSLDQANQIMQILGSQGATA